MIRKFKDYLFARNIQYEEIAPDLVQFKTNGLRYFFENSKSDSCFCRLVVPNIESEEPDDHTRKRAGELTAKYKVGKCIIVPVNGTSSESVKKEQVWLTAELLFFSSINIDLAFDRIISILYTMFLEYKK